MVDIHCHILPGVDDGARSIEDSLAMLKNAREAGVEIVIATPHFFRGVYEIEFAEREQMIAELQKVANENGIDIQIRPGVEYYLSPDICDNISKLAEFTLNNNGRYILVELPRQGIPPYVGNVLSDLEAHGLTPIIAHPERNIIIGRNPNILFDLVLRGCIAQLNVGSILGLYGRTSQKTAQVLLTNRLLHLVASDMHSPRSPSMNQAVPMIESLLGSESASRMFNEIPHRILEGETFDKDPPQRYEPAKKWFKKILSGRRRLAGK